MGAFYTVVVVMVLMGSVWSAPTQTVSATTCNGQMWCVAKPHSTDVELQGAINYACIAAGTDCSPIHQGGQCFQPQTLYNHASFAMNRYYQSRGGHTWDCNFGGIGMFACSDPSHGSCHFDP